MRGLLTALWVACGAGSLLGANSAKASPGQHSAFTLSWNAPAQCPSEDDVREDVARLVGERNDEGPNLTARVRVEAEPGGVWRLLLETELDGTPGEREVEGNSCDAVARAAAVTLALMLNPHTDGDSKASTPPPTTHFGAAAFIDGTHGFMPRWSPELVVGVFGGLGRGSLWLGAGSSLRERAPVSSDASPSSGRGGDLWLLTGEGAACWNFLADETVLGACGLLQVHRLEGRGAGIQNPKTGVIWWTDVGLALVGRVHLSRAFALGARVEGVVPFARPALFIEELGLVHEPSEFGTALGVGAVFRFR